jgi:putative transposase
MHSNKYRIFAVALYYKLVKRVRATLRILGYPTKNSLKPWVREFETDHDNEDFQADAPNAKWLTGFTEVQLPAGKAYLSPMIDCFDGLLVSWIIGTRPNADLVNTMLDEAVGKVDVNAKTPTVNPDRGAHYRWPVWLARIGTVRLTGLMSRIDYSAEKAACEVFFGRPKSALFYPRNRRNTTIEQFIDGVNRYIEWYNEKRIKLSLGARSPIEYRQHLGLAI